jgi:signal transduction histidine kinase
VPALSGAAVAAGVAMAVRGPVPDPAYLLLDAVAGVSFPLVGTLIVSRDKVLGRLFWLSGLGMAAQALAGGYAVLGYGEAGLGGGAAPGLPGAELAAWVANWVFFLGFGPLFLLPILLPDGRPPSARWRPVLAVLVAGLAVLQVMLMFRDRTWLWGRDQPNDHGFVATPVLEAAMGVLVGGLAVAGVVALVVRMRRAEDRRQLLPVLAAATVIALSAVLNAIWPESAWRWLDVVSVALLPVAVAVSIFRYRLFDIELAVRRTVVYVLVTGLLLAAYLVTVATVRTLLGWDGSLAAAAVVAVAFAPARTWAQRVVSRLLFGDRGDPAAALSQLGQRLGASAEPARLLDGVAETIARTLRLPSVAVLDAGGAALSVFGAVPGEGVRMALTSGGRREGELLAGPRSPGEALSRTDLAVLGDLSRHLAVGLTAVRLAGEVQVSRERLVLAREEERRRLRRDLHDGLGPALAAIGMRLDALAAGSPHVGGELREVRQLTRDLVGDVRRIVHDLRPATLDELGLAGALEDLAFDLDGDGSVTVDVAGPLPGLPAAVEVAAYRIAQEALANAVKHAAATRIDVTVRAVAEGLLLRVADDGRGLPEPLVEGMGSATMRERAAELGGSFRRESGPHGGTTVEAILPL